MIYLNLVSKELKKEIELRHIYAVLKRANFILIIITVVVAIIMLTAKILLKNNFNRIVEETTLITKNSLGLNSKIREINDRLNYASVIQSDYIPWSFLLEDFYKNADDNISFNLIKLDKESGELFLRGVAKSRSSLLSLKNKIEKLPAFIELDFPIQNILEKENIDFNINAKLNLAAIKLER